MKEKTKLIFAAAITVVGIIALVFFIVITSRGTRTVKKSVEKDLNKNQEIQVPLEEALEKQQTIESNNNMTSEEFYAAENTFQEFMDQFNEDDAAAGEMLLEPNTLDDLQSIIGTQKDKGFISTSFENRSDIDVLWVQITDSDYIEGSIEADIKIPYIEMKVEVHPGKKLKFIQEGE